MCAAEINVVYELNQRKWVLCDEGSNINTGVLSLTHFQAVSPQVPAAFCLWVVSTEGRFRGRENIAVWIAVMQ